MALALPLNLGSVVDELRLTADVVSTYGLDKWAAQFSLMTAGYRDHIDPNDPWNPETPFNGVTVAIMAEARARVLRRHLQNPATCDIHLGGEVRANTQAFIQLAARIYAAHGFRVHLRKDVPTSPIWYSSYGVFFEEYDGGDNYTASHSPYFKLGWKVMDGLGKQLRVEEDDIIAEVRKIVAEKATIKLAPWESNNSILTDFDVDEPYANYQQSALGADVLNGIVQAAAAGFKCAACPVGGSMGVASRRIFHRLGIPPNAISFFLDAEDSRFHRVGEIGKENFGADVGKAEVCANTGAPAKLLAGEADLVLLWDPDGDRLNVMTTAPVAFRDRAKEFGLSIGPVDGSRMVVYFTPNQLYFLLLEFRISLLRKLGLLSKYHWFVGTTFPTSMAIEELAQQEGLPTIRVPVGFRNLGELCQTIESQVGREQTVTTLTGKQIHLGPDPRAIILCEESGGATLGGPELMRSRKGRHALLALREKDGMQLALFSWAAAISQRESGVSMAEQYCDIIARRKIQYRYNSRVDVALYNESLEGPELQAAKDAGIARRDHVVEFFRSQATALAAGEQQVRDHLRDANPSGAEALSRIETAAWIGDGSLFEMQGARLIIRASGTDALIRYYIETTSPDRLNSLRTFVSGLKL